MIKEDRSLISIHPFIQEFTLAILNVIENKKIAELEKNKIHSDLVPKFSEKIHEESLKKQEFKPIQKNKISLLHTRAPIRPQAIKKENNVKQFNQKIISPLPKKIVPHRIENNNFKNQEYGKITPLLLDPSVTIIECQGPNKELTIIRSGMRQLTRITLNKDEINEIVQTISQKTHIPLLEGVFRAAVDDFTINAIMGELVGTKFVIKKQIPLNNFPR